MLPYEDVRSLPLLYHLNSEPWMNQEAYADAANVAELRPLADPDRAVRLPPAATDTPLGALLRSRRSCREYAVQTMPLETVSTLLHAAYGICDESRHGPLRLSRPVPSAGGLYPLEIRCALTNVEGLDAGVYHFNPLHRCLEPVATRGPLEELGAHLLAQYFLQHANVVIFLSAIFERTLRKYGVRGYRYVLLEAGHVAQNVCLAAAAQQLGALCAGGFRDAPLNRFLGLDGAREAVVYAIGVGYPAA